jgi:hypothetical protein
MCYAFLFAGPDIASPEPPGPMRKKDAFRLDVFSWQTGAAEIFI